jgi:hypothetical protein
MRVPRGSANALDSPKPRLLEAPMPRSLGQSRYTMLQLKAHDLRAALYGLMEACLTPCASAYTTAGGKSERLLP